MAFPTDTVYGLGALVNNLESIEELYAVKERDRVKAVPILLSALTELTQVAADISDTAQRLAERYWPGPLTLVQMVVRFGGAGKPSSVTVLSRIASSGRVISWSGPASTVGGWFCAGLTVRVT